MTQPSGAASSPAARLSATLSSAVVRRVLLHAGGGSRTSRSRTSCRRRAAPVPASRKPSPPHLEADEQAQGERAGDVDRQRAHRQGVAAPGLQRAVEQEAPAGPGRAEQRDADPEGHGAHQRETSPAHQAGDQHDDPEARGQARRQVPDAQDGVAAVDQAQDLDLERRERGQGAAEAGAQERPPVRRGRQALQQAGGEPGQQGAAGDVDREGGPRPPVAGREPALEGRPGDPAEGPAGRHRGELTRVGAGHGPAS